MPARAMWKGRLRVGTLELPVKLFSAAADQRVHFHLLHAPDHARVQQRMLHPSTNEPVEPDDIQRGYQAEPGTFVVLTDEELGKIVPKESRDIEIERFVPAEGVDPQWFVRPYYLGPDGDSADDYSAFARALAAEKKEAIVRWVMRKKAYIGALRADGDYLSLVTLRHSEEIIPPEKVAPKYSREASSKELAMAEQLISMFEGEFDASAYRDEYRERIQAFVEAKARGKKPTLRKARVRKPEKDLAAALAESLKRAGHRKVA